MTSRAFLVVHLDTSVAPAVAISAHIYSEPAHSLTGALGRGRFAVDVIDADGESYEDAKKNVLEARDYYWASGIFEWAFELLEKSEGDQ